MDKRFKYTTAELIKKQREDPEILDLINFLLVSKTNPPMGGIELLHYGSSR